VGHQLRWARTIRVCQPFPFFMSILNNSTLWPLLWLAVTRHPAVLSERRLPVVSVGTPCINKSGLRNRLLASGTLDAAGQGHAGCADLAGAS